LPFSVLSNPHPKIVISTEAVRAFCEPRSGEIRFSALNLQRPTYFNG
jgi:hypothetical protein